MRRDVLRPAIPLAAALMLGVMPLAAQRDADTSAKGYAPTGAEVAASDPWAHGGLIMLPSRSAAAVEQAERAADFALARADSELTQATERRAKTTELIQTRQRQ